MSEKYKKRHFIFLYEMPLLSSYLEFCPRLFLVLILKKKEASRGTMSLTVNLKTGKRHPECSGEASTFIVDLFVRLGKLIVAGK